MPIRLFVINFALGAILVFTGFQIHDKWNRSNLIELTPSNETAASSGTGAEIRTRPYQKRSLVESSYRVIVNRNLFSPERKPPVVEEKKKDEPEAVKEVNVSGKRISLFGVFIMGDVRRALITNPVIGRDEEKYKWVEENDRFGDVQIGHIEKESISITEGIKKYKIILYDQNKQTTDTQKAERATPNIITAGPERKTGAGSAKVESAADDSIQIIKTPFGPIRRKVKND